MWSRKKKDVEELMSLLMKEYEHLEITVNYYPGRELDSTYYRLIAVKDNEYHEICRISQLDNCSPYQYIFGRYTVSIDYLKYSLYNDTIFNEHNIIKDSMCKLQYLEFI